MKIDQATATNVNVPEPDTAGAVQSPTENEQAVLTEAATPGAALAALSSSPTPITANIGGATSVSSEQAERIDNAVRQITSDPEQLLTLLSQSLAVAEKLEF